MLKTVSSIVNAIGALNYKGTWNASTNTPTLTSSSGTKGDYYQVSVAGSTTLDGISNWGVGDIAAFNGATWQRIEGGADLNGVNLTVSGKSYLGTTAAFISAANTLSVSGDRAIEAKSTAGASAAVVDIWNNATSGDNVMSYFRTETSDTLRGSITYNRGAGLIAYNVTSDYRAKDITGPVVDSGSVIDSVPVYMGKMKGATQERPMFIAHETPSYAHTGVKDAVDDEGNPVFQQMDASALVPILWAEVQSLRARLNILESK